MTFLPGSRTTTRADLAVPARPNSPPGTATELPATRKAGGRRTRRCRPAAPFAARRDGLMLDPAHTAKAMAGLIQEHPRRTYTGQQRAVFPHRRAGRITVQRGPVEGLGPLSPRLDAPADEPAR